MQTLISTFDDAELARRAVERLVQLGFDRDDVHLQPGQAAGAVEHQGLLHGIARFFGALFGSDAAGDARRYAEAVRRGSAVVAVDVHDADDAGRAVQALDELGGQVDLAPRAAQGRREGAMGSEPELPKAPPGETVEVESSRMPLAANAALADVTGHQGRIRVIDRPGGARLRDLAPPRTPTGDAGPGALPGSADVTADPEVIERSR